MFRVKATDRFADFNVMKSIILLSFALAAVAFTSGCVNRDQRAGSKAAYLGGFRAKGEAGRADFDNVSYWDGDGVQGAPSIRISISEQRANFYKGGQLVGVSILSTGREGHNTPTGNFRIQQKDQNHVSSIYGDYIDAQGNILKKEIERGKDPMPPGAIYDGARMPYFMRISGGVGMHEGFLPGYPASHGCIRMPGFMAMAFFRNVEVGTPVTITR